MASAAELRQIDETQVIPAVAEHPASRTSRPRPVAPKVPPPAFPKQPPSAAFPQQSPSTALSKQLLPGTVREQRPPAGPGRGRALAAAAAVVAIVLGAAGIAALWGQDDDPVAIGTTPQGSLTSTTAATHSAKSGSGLPADEQCTDEIKANPRWVCLTSATFEGDTLTIEYKANFADAEPNVHGGYHLHIYGGDGVRPAAEDEGRQSMTPAQWYVEDEKPSVRKASSKDYRRVIGDAPKVCARIATADHQLVPDANGTYVTGNCVPINRDGRSVDAGKPTRKPGGSSSSHHSSATPTTSPTPTTPPPPTPTPTSTSTDLTITPASVPTPSAS